MIALVLFGLAIICGCFLGLLVALVYSGGSDNIGP